MTSPPTVAPEDRAAIHDLVTEHAWTLDHGDPTRLADHYTKDGELVGLDKPLIGRDAILAWGRWRAGLEGRTSRHVHVNVRITVEDGVHHGIVTTLLYRHEGDGMGATTPFLVSDYIDTYEKVDGRWLIARRDMRRVFADPARVDGAR